VRLVALSQSRDGKRERMGTWLGAPRGGDSEGGGLGGDSAVGGA
jgi:hypothetical protein